MNSASSPGPSLKNTTLASPVVIGGIGGSGTRLIAELLRIANFYIGLELNAANDNLWFTILFKRIEILTASEIEFSYLLEIFLKLMGKASPDKLAALSSSQEATIRFLTSKPRDDIPESRLARWRTADPIPLPNGLDYEIAWGWKEPNTHIFLERLLNRLPFMKYIYVLRHGLDMALSANQYQLKLWGNYLLGVKHEINPFYSLKYWRKAHERLLQARQLRPNNIYILNYDKLCSSPNEQIASLLEFLCISNKDVHERMLTCVAPPASIGRHKHFERNLFDIQDIDYVASHGFDILY